MKYCSSHNFKEYWDSSVVSWSHHPWSLQSHPQISEENKNLSCCWQTAQCMCKQYAMAWPVFKNTYFTFFLQNSKNAFFTFSWNDVSKRRRKRYQSFRRKSIKSLSYTARSETTNKKDLRETQTLRALAVVRFGHRPPAIPQTGPITIHCAAAS